MADGSGNASNTISLEYLHFIAMDRCVILSETVTDWEFFLMFFEVRRHYIFLFFFSDLINHASKQ